MIRHSRNGASSSRGRERLHACRASLTACWGLRTHFPPHVEPLSPLGAAPYTAETRMATIEVGVVGGGIAGTTIAYELARRGARVTLFERGSIAGEASGRNMGLLLNQIETGVVRIMQRSLDVYRS